VKKAIGLLSLFGAVAICHPMAIAAPNTAVSKSATQVIYASGLVNGYLTRSIDVSTCSQMRVSAELEKDGGASVSLWDETSGGVGVRVVDIPLGAWDSGSNPPYGSQVVDAPGTTLTLYLIVQSLTTAAVTIYCR
jgi:hypothetical protein